MFVLKSIGDQHLRAVSILPRPPVWRSAFFRRGGHYHPTDGEAQEITETMKAADQMTWSGKMNNIRAGAMEVTAEQCPFYRISEVLAHPTRFLVADSRCRNPICSDARPHGAMPDYPCLLSVVCSP